MRKTSFAIGEYYHIYNRGVDKRDIFLDQDDLERFLQSAEEFNVVKPIGSIYENSFSRDKGTQKRLVKIVCFCFNPNHIHLILTPVVEKGVSKFMQKLGTGFTNYFNEKHRRGGSLFQGTFKSVHISTNEQLLRLSVYVNLNDAVHQLGSLAPKLVRNSWEVFTKPRREMDLTIFPEVVLEQFKSRREYQAFAEDLLPMLIEKKEEERELESTLLLEEF